MKKVPNNLEFVRDLTWPEVFEIWRQNEERSDAWRKHWLERGFASWEDWRRRYVEAAGLAESSWKLYRVIDAGRTVAGFHGGSFKSWVDKFYQGVTAPTFAALTEQPDIRLHQGIRQMIETFRDPTTTISAMLTDDGVVIVEGMHRCCAVVLAAVEGKPMAVEFYLALGECPRDNLPIMGGYRMDEAKS
ncbi:hypothetical protein KKF05_00595 [Patescibacteria group bacterium]|nr:hypothetical protein [Patescibacteria group bacterium]MBU1029499.1 hypothetical protein [Patescibacteria group bacterium]MBU1915742.1 hypothetical protein [Patescibacteria group bacterium]